jgi:hypothetical protein
MRGKTRKVNEMCVKLPLAPLGLYTLALISWRIGFYTPRHLALDMIGATAIGTLLVVATVLWLEHSNKPTEELELQHLTNFLLLMSPHWADAEGQEMEFDSMPDDHLVAACEMLMRKQLRVPFGIVDVIHERGLDVPKGGRLWIPKCRR